MSEALKDPQVEAMGYVTPLEDEAVGRFGSVAPPFLLSEHDGPSGRAAPPLGADTKSVLGDAGLSESEIAAVMSVETDR